RQLARPAWARLSTHGDPHDNPRHHPRHRPRDVPAARAPRRRRHLRRHRRPALGRRHAARAHARPAHRAPLLRGRQSFSIAAFMLWAATRREILRSAVGLVIAGNVLWVLGSIAAVFAYSPSGLGYAFVIAQAVVVALLAELEYTGLRRVAS